MPNYMERAFAPAEAAHKAKIIQDTWGHLFPDKEHYTGQIRIASPYYGVHGSTVVLLESDSLPCSSPWWFDAVMEFSDTVGEDMKSGEVIDFDVEVEIVTVMEELEDWEIEEYKEAELEPKIWKEIHITPVNRNILVEGNEDE